LLWKSRVTGVFADGAKEERLMQKGIIGADFICGAGAGPAWRQAGTASSCLLADASRSVDTLTGEGLGLSFRQALAFAEAFDAGELEE